ncbi:DUF4279 domain-containing protein [Hymenobacter sp. BRD67]|uniref:DUF4279 domain-containing protein n=1 Tax=Hymenobacter sp. BRD67 TaxID=2675877 RepID=UPI001565EB12|nr:DUF4279 domain-containing protein [Hymenobacter sp. BRD67]QKG52921.1 DUF4279 domain-containing protein [Hymenobacter sp. BRD67]
MENTQIISAAIAEINSPTFGVTKQFLEIHSVALEEGRPKIAGFTNSSNNLTAIFFAIEGERFYLVVSISTASSTLSVANVYVQEWNRISFHVTSETLNAQQLAALTTLKPTETYNKGDRRKFGTFNYSYVEFEPCPEPGGFKVRLKYLLSFLEQEFSGVRALVDQAEGYLRVISVFHNGNTMLGGLNLDKECIQRMAALNLEIDFDLYAEGNVYKS